MDLTLDSLFSAGGLLGNLSYALLVLSMAMRRIVWLRAIAILSGLTGIAYSYFYVHDPVSTLWESGFTLVNLVQWSWLIFEGRRRRLAPEQERLRAAVFPHMNALEFRRFAAAAQRRSYAEGETLLERGATVDRLYLILEGEADVLVDDVRVSRCLPHDFVGEIGFVKGVPASATVTAVEPTLCLEIDAATLHRMMDRSAEFERGVTGGINANLAAKLIRSNEPELVV